MARQREHTEVSATTGDVRHDVETVVVHGQGVRLDRVDT